ncbi:amino acid adenylation domain-containing protein [Bradyrhizobium sp. USDA 4369]
MAIAMPVANRSGRRVRNTVGLFANIVAIQIASDQADPFSIKLHKLQIAINEVARHGTTPLDAAVRMDPMRRSETRSPYQVGFNYIPWDSGAIQLDGIVATRWQFPSLFSKMGLSFYVRPVDAGHALVELVYNAAAFDEQTVNALLDSYCSLLSSLMVGREPTLASADVSVAPICEESTATDVLDRLAAHAAGDRMREAIRYGECSLNYGALEDISNRLANMLATRGIGHGDVVSIIAQRNHALPLSLLGTWKLGAVAAVVDGRHPPARIMELVRLSGANFVLIDEDFEPTILHGLQHCRAILIPSRTPPCHWFPEHSELRPLVERSSSDPALIQFTSGTTGTPKGVITSHAPLSRFLAWQKHEFALMPTDRFSFLSGIGHDPSLRDMLAPIVVGGSLEIPLQELIDEGALGAWMAEKEISVAHLTPAMGRLAFGTVSHLPKLRLVFFGGDEVRPGDVAMCRRVSAAECTVFYGTTETPQAVLFHRCGSRDSDRARVPLGRPVPGVAAEVRSSSGRRAGQCQIGELIIWGSQLANGYVVDGQLQVDGNFLPASDSLGRGYRTGDLVRLRADGLLEFAGRSDRQVQIRGYRVAPQEVEAALCTIEGVREAVVIPRVDQLGEASLAAFYVGDQKGPPTPGTECGIFFFGDGETRTGPGLYDFYMQAATRADKLGLCAVWTPERHFTEIASAFPNPSLLAASVAMVTERISLRAGSVVAPLHHPIRIAEEWAIVDVLSRGRAQVALASGWLADDFVLAPSAYAARKQAVLAAVPVLRTLWRGDPVALLNGAGESKETAIRPLPLTRGIPLWLTATSSTETFKAARELGTNVLTALNNQSLAELASNVELLRAHSPAGVRHPRIAVMLHTYVAPTDDQARRIAAPALREYLRKHASLRASYLRDARNDRAISEMDIEDVLDAAVERMLQQGLIGSPATCADRLQALEAIGVDEIACLIDFGVPGDLALESIERIAEAAHIASTRRGLNPAAVRSALEARLPRQMVPGSLQKVDSIPLTKNGKVDYRALLAALSGGQERPYSAPTTGDQSMLCAILAEAFQVPRVGIDDDFFELGGYSLLALKVARQFEELSGRTLPVRLIFLKRTVSGICQSIASPTRSTTDCSAASTQEAFPGAWPLSIVQANLWMAEELSELSGVMNVTATLRLRGELNAEMLRRSVSVVTNRHPMLRTIFVRTEEGIVQQMIELPDVPFIKTGSTESDDVLDERVRRLANEPIDRFTATPFRAVLIANGPKDHVLALTVHHSASDGQSLHLVLSEIADAYRSFAADREPALPALRSHYAQYAERYSPKPLNEQTVQRLRRLADKLRDADPVLEFPGAKHRLRGTARAGSSSSILLPSDVHERLRVFCATHGCTPFAVFHATYGVLLANYSGRDDFLCGIATAGRPLPEHERTVGPFANLVVSRVQLDLALTFLDVVAASSRSAIEAMDSESLRFEWLLEEMSPARPNDRHPLVQAVITVHDSLQASGTMSLPGLDVELTVGEHTQQVLFDLTLAAIRTDAGWSLRLDHAADVFDVAGARRFLQTFRNILVDGLSKPHVPVWNLELVNAEEKILLLKYGRGSDSPTPTVPLHDLVLNQSARRPNAIAVRYRQGAVTYGGLVQRSTEIAGKLLACGIKPGDVVGIHMRRTPDMVAGLLAILRCGCAYLPLERDLPDERLKLLVTSSKARCVLSDDASAGQPRFGVGCIDSGEPTAEDDQAIASWPRVPVQDTACVLFTSGSTGVPKGVCIPHQGIVRLVRDTNYIAISESDVILHANTLAFDLSNFDIWGALTNGAALALIDDELPRLDAIADGAKRHAANVALLATGVFHALVEEIPQALMPVRTLLVAGDVLSPKLTSEILDRQPDLTIINGYGPTECSTLATAWLVRNGSTVPSPVPIGRAISNTRTYVLNRGLQPVPVGMAGELYIGGPGVANGYIEREDLTAERFIPSPFDRDDVLYRTGDVVCLAENGELQFLGRADQQVKIRGIRVELGEVQAELQKLPEIHEAVVLPIGDGALRTLAAFVVTVRRASIHSEDVIAALRQRLPPYLIPSIVRILPIMPLTVNGKVDRAALIALGKRHAARPGDPRDATPAERLVADVIKDVLAIADVGLDDDFFDLGGTSLAGLRVVSRLRVLFNIDLKLASVFLRPTVSGMVQVLKSSEAQEGRTEAVARAHLRVRADPELGLTSGRVRHERHITTPAEEHGAAAVE